MIYDRIWEGFYLLTPLGEHTERTSYSLQEDNGVKMGRVNKQEKGQWARMTAMKMYTRACHHFIFMELDFFHMIFCCLKVHKIQRKKEIIDFSSSTYFNLPF